MLSCPDRRFSAAWTKSTKARKRNHFLTVGMAFVRAMAGTQVPKGVGIAFAVIGVPLIIMSAAGTHKELEALNASGGSEAVRVDQCIAKTMTIVPDPSLRRAVCACVVHKAAARGGFKDFGAYDRRVLDPIADECLRGKWD